MPPSTSEFPTLDDWIAREAIGCPPDAPGAFDAAVDRVMASVGGGVDLLGLGEALHGGEEVLVLRNRLFQRLVAAHGFTAIAIESSFPRGRLVDDYVAGRGPAAASYDDVREAGFSHEFGRLQTSRELVEWMRLYNADAARPAKLRFYGFDSPTEMMYSDSPRALLALPLDYLASVDALAAAARRGRVELLIGADADWENPAANMDPAKSVGSSPAAAALRLEAEDLLTELRVRRPELVAATGAERYAEAVHYAASARQFLGYHASVARPSDNRVPELLGMRDLMMADNLAYAADRERARGGRLLAFAHNSHLKRGRAMWQLGPHALAWWPAGAQVAAALGPRYAVIGSAVGTSDDNGIAAPEPGTLEARLVAAPGPVRFVPTHLGEGLPAAEVAALPTRTGSPRNPGYFPLTAQSLTDFDWIVALDTTAYSRGGRPLP